MREWKGLNVFYILSIKACNFITNKINLCQALKKVIEKYYTEFDEVFHVVKNCDFLVFRFTITDDLL